MLPTLAINRLFLGISVGKPASLLIWLLVASVAAAGFTPNTGRSLLRQANQQNEEDPGQRQSPVEEEVRHDAALVASRHARFSILGGAAATSRIHSVLHRPAQGAQRPGRPAEMARRNGVGSVLRC